MAKTDPPTPKSADQPTAPAADQGASPAGPGATPDVAAVPAPLPVIQRPFPLSPFATTDGKWGVDLSLGLKLPGRTKPKEPGVPAPKMP